MYGTGGREEGGEEKGGQDESFNPLIHGKHIVILVSGAVLALSLQYGRTTLLHYSALNKV